MIGFKTAHERRDEARRLLTNDVAPSEIEKAQKAKSRERMERTLETAATRWFEMWKTGVTDSTAESQWSRSEHIMPTLGALPLFPRRSARERSSTPCCVLAGAFEKQNLGAPPPSTVVVVATTPEDERELRIPLPWRRI
jgi:hypothetical protein